MKIGERIKKRRAELELSQDDLAKRLGYKSRSSINKIENDASGLPQTKIVAIANALKTTPAYIMGWEEVQKKNDADPDIIERMQSDNVFLSVVQDINKLDAEKLIAAQGMISALLK